MGKHLSKYAIICIAILLAELLSAYFFLVMEKYKSASIPYRSTAIHMVAALLIYYPLFTFMEKHFKSGSKNLVKNTQKATKHNLWGVILAFGIAFFFIWIALVRIWYNRNFFEDLGVWIERVL
jgi:hypothetical protein